MPSASESAPREPAAWLAALLWGGLALLALGGPLLLAAIARLDPDVPFLLREPGARWITLPGLDPGIRVVPADGSRSGATFRRQFTLREVPERARLRVRAMRTLSLRVNGAEVPLDGPCSKRACEADVSDRLARGANRIEAQVIHRIGPPLLWLRLEGPEPAIASGEGWTVQPDDGPPAAAQPAEDARAPEPDAPVASPLEGLARRAPLLLVAFALGAAAFAIGRGRLSAEARRRLPDAVLAGAVLFWLGVLGFGSRHVPIDAGFDAEHHVAYVRYLLAHGALPLGSQGLMMYHPPAYYAVSAGLLALFRPETGGAVEALLLKLVPWLSGLGLVAISWAVARRLFPERPALQAFATGFAALLPLNLSTSAYVSNESFHALAASGALWAAAAVVERGTPRRGLALAALLGLALLSKYTALLVALLCLGAVGLAGLAVERVGPWRAALRVAAIALGAAAIGAWPYLRNAVRLGDPFFWNLDGLWGLVYWQPPGFHTLDYYTAFGRVLVAPWHLDFVSFWDAIYAGAWGDGLAQTVAVSARHPAWSYDAMGAVYLLALPATAVLGLGALRAAWLCGRHPRADVRIALALGLALGLALLLSGVAASLRYGFHGAARAGYLLAGTVPAALCAGLGLETVDEALARVGGLARAALYGWLAALSAAIASTFV